VLDILLPSKKWVWPFVYRMCRYGSLCTDVTLFTVFIMSARKKKTS